MAQYTVSEVAARTGFSPSTLRYYDRCGLAPPTARSDAGYRLYDERSVEWLGFVARAKRLGLGLDDIADLLALWDADECAPVQARLGELVAARRAEIERGIAELRARSDELVALEGQLAQPPHPGACDDGCACLTESSPHPPAPVPIVCNLRDAPDTPAERIEAYRRLFADAYVGRERTGTGIRFRFRADDGIEDRVRELADRETRCCGFFSFTTTLAGDEVLWETTVPDDDTARAVLDEWFELPNTVHDDPSALPERLAARGLEFVAADLRFP